MRSIHLRLINMLTAIEKYRLPLSLTWLDKLIAEATVAEWVIVHTLILSWSQLILVGCVALSPHFRAVIRCVTSFVVNQSFDSCFPLTLALTNGVGPDRLSMALLLLRGLSDTFFVLVNAVNHLGIVVGYVQNLWSLVTRHAKLFDQKNQLKSILVWDGVIFSLVKRIGVVWVLITLGISHLRSWSHRLGIHLLFLLLKLLTGLKLRIWSDFHLFTDLILIII